MTSLDEQAFIEIEKNLNIKLPLHFKKFHLSERGLIAKLRDLQFDGDVSFHIYLATDCKWIIQHNRDFLQFPKYKGFASNKICIGTDGCGNDSLISLDEQDIKVYFLDHECWAEDAGIEYDDEIDELKFDFENDDIDWARFAQGNNLVDYTALHIRWMEEANEEMAKHNQ